MGERRTTGILRRDPVSQPVIPDAELLVFGYQCKVYRDDAKALWIDQGKHLIPCPSNTTLKVDRYDVRGALSDLSKYEPIPGGYGDRLACLSPAERRAEELCEEERYWSLYNHDVDEIYYQGQTSETQPVETGAQIAFNYDQGAPPKPETTEEEEEPFVAPRKFFIPPAMTVPETMKQHAVIEKTARFIASQGVQMEILLKAKQSNNPLFAFLLHDDRLNPYYKHMLDAIKGNNYPKEEEKAPEEAPVPEKVEPEPPPIVIPVAKYAPSQDCVYFKLMNSIGKISGIPTPVPASNGSAPEEAPVKSSGLRGLVEYNSDSDSDEGNDGFEGTLPPEQILHIVDKTAIYVNKNGSEFENILRTKQDPRFEFLNPGHEYHAYYQFKLHGNIVKGSRVEPREPAPVSFSIKPQDPPPPKLAPSTLSRRRDEDDDSEDNGEDVSKYDIANIMEEEKQKPPTPPQATALSSDIERKMQEARRAEERIRNKLAAQTREKLNAISKEKQLQAERKKRAMAFISSLKKTDPPEVAPQAPTLPSAPKMGPISYESDATSIHSVPTPEETVEISSESEGETKHKKRKHKEGKSSRSRHKKKSKKSSSSHKSRKKRSRARSSSRSSTGSSRSRSSSKESRRRSRTRDRSRSRSRSRHKSHKRHRR